MERNISIDVLKVILAFFVIALHGEIFKDINPELSFYIVNGIFRVGVPVFLIITGFYFFHINKLGEWLKRLFILYFTWMLIYSYFFFEVPTTTYLLTQDIFFFVFGYHHLWYLVGTLLGGGLLYLVRNLSTKFQLSSAIVFFLLGVSMQYLGNMHYFSRNIDRFLNFYPAHRNFITVCYPFLTIGFLINKHNLINKIKNTRYLILLSILVLYLEVFINFNYISKKEALDGLFSLLIVCPLLFILFSRIKITGSMKTIALFSTAIYLVHPLFQKLLRFYGFSSITSFFTPVILSTIAAYILILLNSKTRYLL